MQDAISELERYVRETYDPDGIVLTGSLVRGEGGPTSDLDVVVVHRCPWRLREQRRFAGVPSELFVNPPQAIRRYFASEHAAARPCMAHMLVTGRVLGRAEAVVAELVSEARDWLARPPPALSRDPLRYHAVDLLDDARDVHGLDPAAELQLLSGAVERIVEYAFRVRGRTLPRRKAAVAALAELDPLAADGVRSFAAAAPPDRLAAVEALALHVLGVDTFFSWRSPPDPA